MSDPYIGDIRIWAASFPPRGWAFCQGQILSIAQNTALFSLLGVNYGGNGQTTFALPNMTGRVPVGTGSGPGLTPVSLGEQGGVENVTLISNQIPIHKHAVRVQPLVGDTDTPSSSTVLAAAGPTGSASPYGASVGGAMATTTVAYAGGNQPHNNMQPYLPLNFIIALQGIYPSRN